MLYPSLALKHSYNAIAYMYIDTCINQRKKEYDRNRKKKLNIAQNISALKFCLASNLTRKNEKLDVYVTFIPM